MNEWEFTGDVASWINVTLSQTSISPFSEAKIEQRGTGSNKRRDLTLLDASKKPILTGEVKLPYAADGGTPHNQKVVEDARRKAQRAKAKFFFTWNVNECVLWETVPAQTAWLDREFRSWRLPNVHVRSESHLENPIIQGNIKTWLVTFLNDVAQIIRGEAAIGAKSPDEKFVEALESSLEIPVMLTVESLSELHKRAPFRKKLDQWMREDQGWIISTEPDDILDNLTRASKFSCYALVNKLVFYEALLKRYGAKLPKLDAPDHITTGEELRNHLEAFFADAKRVTGDYETVFGENHQSVGNVIPFYADPAVPHWRQIINQIHLFDFSKLDYEVIGSIFERLISPEERHKYGQFYTRVEVVDLINSFCIREGDEKVMDPACGGGTFLVRAYARKRELNFGRKHRELLSDLYGVDISTFATHLTTINLATRELIDEENYPRIARSDFFNVEPNHTFLSLPIHLTTKGLGKTQHRDISIPPLDAVVTNPPYIQQEDIPRSSNRSPKPGTKEYYQSIVKEYAGADLSGRSDIHCYFWPHASRFLKDDGWLCLITSSQWLDVEYGYRLQEWLLRNFQIVAVLESIDEPWFVGARVATTVTIAQKQLDPDKRMNNDIRFIQMRKPIAEILAHEGSTAGAMEAANGFREEILSLKKDTLNQRYRARLIRQGDLWNKGVNLAVIMDKDKIPPSSEPNEQKGDYLGAKWGMYLRAPDLWFDLLDTYGQTLVPLGSIAEIRYGVKTGNDDFFIVTDCNKECLEKDNEAEIFKGKYGVNRSLVEKGKIRLVKCGKKKEEIRPIEEVYLIPEVHSLMELNNYTICKSDCSRMLILLDKQSKATSKYANEYIRWGEKRGYDKAACIQNRTTANKEWFILTGAKPAPILWPKEKQYRHIAPTNPDRIIANCRLYEVHPNKYKDDDMWGGILNSSIVILSSIIFGRPMGTEGNWSMMVGDTKRMLVPDPYQATNKSRQKVAIAFRKMKKRKALSFLSEQRLRKMKYKATL